MCPLAGLNLCYGNAGKLLCRVGRFFAFRHTEIYRGFLRTGFSVLPNLKYRKTGEKMGKMTKNRKTDIKMASQGLSVNSV